MLASTTSKRLSIFKYFPTFCVLSAVYIKLCFASLQQVTFFENMGCSGGKNQSFTETQDELDRIWVTNSSSIFLMGLWAITFYKSNINDTRHTETYVHYNTKPPKGRCMNKTEWPDLDVENYNILYAARYGPEEMTKSKVIFFTGFLYQGLHFVADTKETEQLTPRPVAIWSQLIFSNDSWTSYPGYNFTGKATHYLPSGQFGINSTIVGPPLKDNFSFNNTYLGIVKSAKMGIHGDNIDEDSKPKSDCSREGLNFTVMVLSFLVYFVIFLKNLV